MRIITEEEFRTRITTILRTALTRNVGAVTGPGRSGAVAAVYASHLLRVPFIPYGSPAPKHLGRLLIVDTAQESGRTIRKALCRYRDANPFALVAFHEPPRVAFWYEECNLKTYRIAA